MDKNLLKKYRNITKTGNYYRKLKKNREKCEEFLKNLYSTSEQNEVVSIINNATHSENLIGIDTISTSSDASVDYNEDIDMTIPSDNENEFHCDFDNDGSNSNIVESNGETLNVYSTSKNNDNIEMLRKWAIMHNITHLALNDILRFIKRQYGDLSLPLDARTLLKTPKKNLCKKISGGEYWHQGLEICLINCFKNLKYDLSIQLNINIDGLPIHKSSKRQFWPILFNIHSMPHIHPMPIGIFYGNTKPLNLTEFLDPFVEEFVQLQENGIHVNGHKIIVKIRCFICDSPARAFVKGVVNFNGIHGCLKCTTKGEHSNVSNTVVFPTNKCHLRTDEKFRRKAYGDHHRGLHESPLLKIHDLDMIQDFVVADSLHLLELGVMKRCLVGWRDGRLGFAGKLCSREIDIITQKLLTVKLPSEIHRSMRGMDCLAFWKGVEWRCFLNYVGIVVLKDVLDSNVYQHFLLLFVAVTICSSDRYANNRTVAQLMFEKYIDDFKIIYGVEYITSNIHNLEHIVNDVNRFGSLNTISSYPFENSLYMMKNLLRQGNNSLQQLANRVFERNLIVSENSRSEVITNTIKRRDKVVQFCTKNGFCLKSIMKDSWYMTRDEEIVQMNDASTINGKIFIHGCSIKHKNEFFKKPIQSSNLYIYSANISHLNQIKLYNSENMLCKLVAIEYRKNEFVFIPLLHTLV